MSEEKPGNAQSTEPTGDDELGNELLNAEAAKKLKQAEDQIKETAHDIERNLK
ncbi:hypothetical protein [Glutamicibacter sp. NPDC087344]|uniref:hypothetical protein n=1 Tax=Glutamicibacter sp. NPDC087344 TaxID=3363994 RepID=UPI003809C46E